MEIPEGAVEVTRPAVAEMAAVEWGKSLPKDADPVALKSLKEAEAILLALSELEPALQPADSREQAMYVADEAEKCLALLAAASADPGLQIPSQTRVGDAYRIVWQAVMRTRPSPQLSPDDLQEYNRMLAEAGDPLAVEARVTYERVLANPLAPPVWQAHARWGLAQLEELG